MSTCGVDTIIVDLKDDMAEGCFDIIQAQARYDGGYWNTTGIGRYVTCRGLIGAMQANKVDVLAHGATGRGNDQMRFERYTNVLAPKMAVFAPWRDAELLEEFPGRTEMAAYLQTFKIEAFVGPKKKYSTDANLAGLSHEAEDLESVETPMLIVDPEMGVWPKDAPDKVENVTLQFKAGRCVAINGKKMSPQQAIREANAIGGRNGVGISHALENRIIGTKSRGVYEAPGMELLGTALTFVYQSVLDRRATKLFEHLSALISDQVHSPRSRARSPAPPARALPPCAPLPPTLPRHSPHSPALRRTLLRPGDGGVHDRDAGADQARDGHREGRLLQGQHLLPLAHRRRGHALQRGRFEHGGERWAQPCLLPRLCGSPVCRGTLPRSCGPGGCTRHRTAIGVAAPPPPPHCVW